MDLLPSAKRHDARWREDAICTCPFRKVVWAGSFPSQCITPISTSHVGGRQSGRYVPGDLKQYRASIQILTATIRSQQKVAQYHQPSLSLISLATTLPPRPLLIPITSRAKAIFAHGHASHDTSRHSCPSWPTTRMTRRSLRSRTKLPRPPRRRSRKSSARSDRPALKSTLLSSTRSLRRRREPSSSKQAAALRQALSPPWLTMSQHLVQQMEWRRPRGQIPIQDGGQGPL